MVLSAAQLAHAVEDEPDGEVGDIPVIDRRTVGDRDASGLAGGEIDVVVTGSKACDEAQVWKPFEDGVVHGPPSAGGDARPGSQRPGGGEARRIGVFPKPHNLKVPAETPLQPGEARRQDENGSQG
jgi:hypothetical protein